MLLKFDGYARLVYCYPNGTSRDRPSFHKKNTISSPGGQGWFWMHRLHPQCGVRNMEWRSRSSRVCSCRRVSRAQPGDLGHPPQFIERNPESIFDRLHRCNWHCLTTDITAIQATGIGLGGLILNICLVRACSGFFVWPIP